MYVNLRFNSLTGKIPYEVNNIKSRIELNLSDKNFQVPFLPRSKIYQNWYTFLHRNELTAPIPKEIENLSKLEILVLLENKLSGRIQTSVGNLKSLKYFCISDNLFSGEIPVEF